MLLQLQYFCICLQKATENYSFATVCRMTGCGAVLPNYLLFFKWIITLDVRSRNLLRVFLPHFILHCFSRLFFCFVCLSVGLFSFVLFTLLRVFSCILFAAVVFFAFAGSQVIWPNIVRNTDICAARRPNIAGRIQHQQPRCRGWTILPPTLCSTADVVASMMITSKRLLLVFRTAVELLAWMRKGQGTRDNVSFSLGLHFTCPACSPRSSGNNSQNRQRPSPPRRNRLTILQI